MKKESQKKVELMSIGTTFNYRGGNYVVVGIEDDKYLLHTRCKLWNKKQDILKSLQKYKANSKNENTNASANASASANMEIYTEEIPINELYQFYCIGKNKFTVSKRYFERFIKEESQLYIIEDNFIKVESFSNI